MATAERVSSRNPSGSKRKRSHSPAPELREEEKKEVEVNNDQKKKKNEPGGAWANLNLVLSLQNKDTPLERKIEIAYDFIGSIGDCSNRGPEVVPVPRLVSFLIEWIQRVLISAEKNKKSSELWDPCFDYKGWAVLGFCLGKTSSGVSPNLLRSFTRVASWALLHLKGDGPVAKKESAMLFKQVLECLSLLLSSSSRAFYSAGVELWISCVVEIDNLVRMVLTKGEVGPFDAEVMKRLSVLLFDHFSSFLRFHPKPKHIFRAFVDRLLEPLLELLVLLHIRASGGKRAQEEALLGMVEDVLSNGLFHPAHISGFLSLRNSRAKQDNRELGGINESYHSHFFHKLKKIIVEKKAVSLGGFGYLLHLFVTRVKSQNRATLASKSHPASGRSTDVLEEDQETDKPLFGVFMQFLEPLLLECRRCADIEFLQNEEFLERRLVEIHCMLKSLNETLASFIHENIYIRTEDTSEEAHFNFLKEVYGIIAFVSQKIYQFWLSVLNVGNERIKKMLPLIAKEVFVAVGCFLEVEYRVIGNDLMNVWLIMFSYLAIQMPSADTKYCSLLVSEILNLGCLIIKVYGELRQVTTPLFAFCKAVRLLRDSSDAHSSDQSISVTCFPLSSDSCLKSLAILLSSQAFRVAICDAIRSVPERQASECIDLVKVDLIDSLEWIRHGFLGEVSLSLNKTSTLSSSVFDLSMQAEDLGRILSEVYTLVLDSLTVTSTNSVLVGNSVENLMKALRPSFSHLVQNPSDGVNCFILSLTGKNLSDCVTEGKSVPLAIPDVMSWLFVFFFRMFISCRSLHRQSISLMPPSSARKASDAMGNLFLISNGMQWKNELKSLDQGYFSWVIKPSIPVQEVIYSLPKAFLSSSCPSYPHLVYVLHVMALQRLNDLNRKIKAFEFLQEGDSQLKQTQLGNSDTYKSSKRLDRLLIASRQEAVELVNLMRGYLPLLASNQKFGTMQSEKTGELERSSIEDCTWDMSICSLNENSLPVGIWWLLCQNIDVWSSHAANEHMENYVFHLLQYALTCGTAERDPTEQHIRETFSKKVSMHQIAQELLSDSVLYEQTVISRHLTSRFCYIFKKSLAHVLDHVSSINDDLCSLPEWSDMSNILIDGGVIDSHVSFDPSPLSRSKLVSSDKPCVVPREDQSCLSLCLEASANLLHLLYKSAAICVNVKSFPVYVTSILNLERLLLSNLLNHHGESSPISHFELFKLFISCRRAMKYLVVQFVKDTEAKHSSSISSVFNNSTILWLLKSISLLVELPRGIFGETYTNCIRNLLNSLIEHTSYIFFAISKEQMALLFMTLLSDGKLDEKITLSNELRKKDNFGLADWQSDAFKHIKAGKYLESMAVMMENQIRDLFVTLKNNFNAMTPEVSLSNLDWTKLSSIISCLQGFLGGLATSLHCFLEDHSDSNQLSFLCFSLLSNLTNHIIEIENFVRSCIIILLVDDSQGNKYHLMKKVTGSHVDNGFLEDVNMENPCHGDDRNDSLDEEHKKSSRVKRNRASKTRVKCVRNAFNTVHELDFANLQFLRKSFLQSLLKGENSHIAFLLRQLFSASAAILKVKCMLLYPKDLEHHGDCHKLTSNSMAILVGTSHILLQGVAEMVPELDPFTYVWVDGPLKYLEVVGSFIHLSEPNLSEDLYAQLIHTHMRSLGTCISLQGKSATLSSQETGSTTKMLHKEMDVEGHEKQILNSGKCSINTLKVQLRISFIEYIRKPTKLHLKAAVLAIEKALVGLKEHCHTVYKINTGSIDGGKVSPIVAGGIDALDLLLEHFSGKKRVINESILRLIGCLFNIVFHLQRSTIFYLEKPQLSKTEINPDAGSVVLMCVEVLTKVAGSHSFQMDSFHVSQCLSVPLALFKDFHQLSASRIEYQFSPSATPEARASSNVCHYDVDRQFSIDLYCSCCKLLYTTLRHRIREVERCIALLQNSVNTLLTCLETVDANLASRKGNFTWDVQEAVKCASYLRRIYEEIRQQKDALGKYSMYFLSTYIKICSGFGPFQTGFKREIDEALRPGIYSLIDICTATDHQRLHTVLCEGPCRATLATLLDAYKLNFQFEGKV